MTASIETRLVRATTSRKATELTSEFGNQFDRIVIGERPAPKSEGWIISSLSISELANYSIREVYYKTATLYGASAVYVRPVDGDNATVLRSELNLFDQCDELAFWSNDSEINEDYLSLRVLLHRSSSRYFVVGIGGGNVDDRFEVCATEQIARTRFADLVSDLQEA